MYILIFTNDFRQIVYLISIREIIMKIGVSSYSFEQYIKNKKMTQFDTIEKAKELGFDAIEFTDLVPDDESTQEEYAVKCREKAKEVGIEITSYTISANLLQETDELLKEEIKRLKRQIDIADLLGVKKMRHDAFFNLIKYRTYYNALPEVANACRILTEYAAPKGIRTMVENHGFVCQDSIRLEQLVASVNHENFGLLVDMGNFICADEDPVIAVSRLAPYAFHVHTKDMKLFGFDYPSEDVSQTRGCNKWIGTITGRGDVPVKRCIEILKRAGYDDVFSVEFEGGEDCIDALSDSIAYLRRL